MEEKFLLLLKLIQKCFLGLRGGGEGGGGEEGGKKTGMQHI